MKTGDGPVVEPSDAELLRLHLQADTEAFGRLVRRHVDLVYAAARRQTGDPALAEDVTQAVFLVLAKKAAALANYPTIAGWLIVTTRNVSKTAMRSKFRRQKHEQAAAKAEGVAMSDSLVAAELGRLIDGALAKLPNADRDAVTLRLLKDLSFADVGVALNVSEDAARKRFDRAVVRLRSSLTNKGLAVTAAGLVSASQTFAAVTAPPALAIQITAAPSASAGVLAKGMLKMMTVKKVALATAAVLAASTVTGGLLTWREHAVPPAAAIAQAPPQQKATTTLVGEYYIGGDGAMPGAYAISGRQIKVTQAIVAARTALDGPFTVGLVQRTSSGEQTSEIAFEDLISGKNDPVLQPDDHVIVRRSRSGLEVQSLAIEYAVSDVEANIAFFEKLGFPVRFREEPDANGLIKRASVSSGVVAIRLTRADRLVQPNAAVVPSFWVAGGPTELIKRRDAVRNAGISAGEFTNDVTLRSFRVATPDGYQLEFYSLKD